MEFRPVRDCLPAWLTDEIEKMAAAVEAAAKVEREKVGRDHPSPLARPVLQVVSNSRELAAHAPRARPSLGAVNSLRLVVDNGRAAGTRGEEARAPAYQRGDTGAVS